MLGALMQRTATVQQPPNPYLASIGNQRRRLPPQ
jgi:hypothetical protein